MTCDMSVDEFENEYNGLSAFINALAKFLNILAEWIKIISVSSAGSRRRFLEATVRVLGTSSSSQTVVVSQITINSGAQGGSTSSSSYADAQALENALN
jgi:hypothetical protein